MSYAFGLTAITLTAASLVVWQCFKLIATERAAAATERARHAEQIDRLLQRIQAPAAAVYEHTGTVLPAQPAPSVALTDEELWSAAGVHPVDGDPGRVYEPELA